MLPSSRVPGVCPGGLLWMKLIPTSQGRIARAFSSNSLVNTRGGGGGRHSITKHMGGWLEGLSQKPQNIYSKIAILEKC